MLTLMLQNCWDACQEQNCKDQCSHKGCDFGLLNQIQDQIDQVIVLLLPMQPAGLSALDAMAPGVDPKCSKTPSAMVLQAVS